jgi:hypothetical protein
MHFSIQEAFVFGWHKTKAHSGLLFKALLTLFALEVAQVVVQHVLGGEILGFLAWFALMIGQLFVGMGFIWITLKLARGEHAAYDDLLPPARLAWKYVLAILLSGILTFLGLLLLIVPGIYLMLRFSTVRYAILDGATVTQSLKRSGVLTNGIKWRLLGFFLLCGFVNLLGLVALGIGLLVTIPVSTIAFAHIYQKLRAHHGHA